jgi:ubiquinone/menaquinone biosynthesis C-methylase UbiE
LELPDNSQDYAFSVFGLIMFPDQAKGFKELYRVIKPGGKAAVTSWSLNQIMINLMKRVKELITFTITPVPNNGMRLADKKVFEQDMIDAGFKDGKIRFI